MSIAAISRGEGEGNLRVGAGRRTEGPAKVSRGGYDLGEMLLLHRVGAIAGRVHCEIIRLCRTSGQRMFRCDCYLFLTPRGRYFHVLTRPANTKVHVP